MTSSNPLSQYTMASEKTVTETKPTEFEKNQKRYQDLISTFPHAKGWFSEAPLIEYGGHWNIQPLIEGCLHAQEVFKPRPLDFLICSNPKSGTTWLKALTFAIANRSRLEDSSNPLLNRNPHELVPFIEIGFAYFPQDNVLKEEGNNSTLFSTHIPFGLLPESVVKSGCKMVYIWRDPKDTFISMWTFLQKQRSESYDCGSVGNFEESFDMFCRGVSLYGPYLDHVLGYWKAYQENPDKILFLKYETMRADPIPYVKRLAEYMGCGFTDEEEKKGVVEKIVKLCSFESLKSLEVNQGEQNNREWLPMVYYPNSSFFRKGKVGDWHNYLTPEMAARLDGLVQEKFMGSGLLEHGL